MLVIESFWKKIIESLFFSGSRPQDWSKETGARVPFYHRKYSGGKNRGTCGNETPLGLHCHSAR